jgi:hypothetical protein
MMPRLRRGKNQTARAGKKEGGWGEGIFAHSRFPPPPNFVPTKLARRLTTFKIFSNFF